MAFFIPDRAHERDFRDALGQFATGVTLVTTTDAEGPVGITANSFAAVSLDPPLVLWSPARASSRFGIFAQAEHFSIHVLAADQVEICRRFTRNPRDFSGLEADFSDRGVPHLHGALARFDCGREATYDGGDHLIIVGRVTAVDVTAGAPLVFHGGHFTALA